VTGVPEVTVSLVWAERGHHPAVPEFAALARRCVAEAGVATPEL
jgi:hypothetical protein